MASKNKTTIALLSVMVFVFLFAVGYFVYYTQTQQAAFGEVCTSNADCPAGYECVTGVCERIITSTLKGKAVTVSVFAYDKASNTPATSKIVAPLYLVKSPIVTSTKVSGEGFAADGTVLSSTARTDVTEGLTVGDKVVAIAANGSYYGAWSAVKTLETQAVNLDLDTWAIATSGGDIELKDEAETVITVSGTATTNLTLGASETENFYYLKIKNNNTDTGWNVAGFFIDKAANTNISTFSGEGTTSESYSISYAKDGSFGLERTDADDVMFTLANPVMLLEYDQIKFNDLQVQADGDGCSGELFSIYVFDNAWFRSSQENAMMYGAETDANSPADVGASDMSKSYYCSA